MHQILLKYIFFIFLLIIPFFSKAQTAGSGTIATIEAKANAIAENDEKVGKLNRQHLETYSLEQEKLEKLKKELKDLIAEKEAVLDEYRRGQFCTGCNVPRSQFKSGESFPHSGQSVRAATPQELAAKEKVYDDRINSKSVELKNFEFAENEFTRKRADLDKQMNQLKDNSDRLRAEIVELSKRYKEQVVQESKSYQSSWASDLMRIIAEKHYVEDRIDIYKVKYDDLAMEETKSTAEIKDKVRKQNEADIQNLNGKISVSNSNLINQEKTFLQKDGSLKNNQQVLYQRLNDVKQKLINAGNLAATEKTQLEVEKQDLENRIEQNKNELAEIKTSFDNNKQTAENEIKGYRDKIWQLTTNLSKRQNDALAGLKEAFANKRRVINEAIDARKISLQTIGDLLIQKRAAYRQKNNQYASMVDTERVRLINACSKAGCSCFGIDTQQTVVGNWSASSSCVSSMEHSKDINTFYGCTEEAPIYKQHYASLINGLTDSDLSALKRRTSKTQYDLIFQKVTN